MTRTEATELDQALKITLDGAERDKARQLDAMLSDASRYGWPHAIAWYGERVVKSDWTVDLWLALWTARQKGATAQELAHLGEKVVMGVLLSGTCWTGPFARANDEALRSAAATALETVRSLVDWAE